MKPRTAVLAVSAAALIAVSAAPAAAGAYTMTSKAYGKRYCEMGVAHAQGSGMHVDIYNTFGLNDCPAAAWSAAITPTALAGYTARFGALATAINGPRWWAFDSIGGELSAEVTNFGTIGMRKAATLDFTTLSLPPFFTPFTVHRTSTWVYNRGTYMRILTAPDGKKYAMQAWTTQVDSTLKASNLNAINSGKSPKLKLPSGWKWKAVKATKKTTIVAPGTMTIVQDNLKNVYSLIS